MTFDDSHLAPVDVVARLRFERALARMLDAHGPSRPVASVPGCHHLMENEVVAALDAETIRRVVAAENEFDGGVVPDLQALPLILIRDHVDGRALRTEAFRSLFDEFVAAIHEADPWQFDDMRAADLRNEIDRIVDAVADMIRRTDPGAEPSVDAIVRIRDEDDDWYDDDLGDEDFDEEDEDEDEDEDDLDLDDHDVDLHDLRAVIRAESPPLRPAGPRVWYPRSASGG